jgi:hypothetical protein
MPGIVLIFAAGVVTIGACTVAAALAWG